MNARAKLTKKFKSSCTQKQEKERDLNKTLEKLDEQVEDIHMFCWICSMLTNQLMTHN